MTRPRLGDHVRARRHLVGDERRVVLIDGRSDRQMVMGEREWRVLRAMDGTRDLEGIALASGVSRDHVSAFLDAAEELGLTGDAEPHQASSSGPAPQRPVVCLPGVGFSCSGSGSCCELADSILFTPLESARARAAAPDVLDAGHVGERAFTPASGLDGTLLAVAAKDGACAYLRADRACGVYDVRPHGCRTHPIRFVDVGHEIRVAPRFVCACELEPSEAPLTHARRGAELPPELWVETLPAVVRVGAERLPRAEALAWSDGLRLPDGDVAAWCSEKAAEAGAAPIDWAAVRAQVHGLSREHAWRAPTDALALGLRWIQASLDRDMETADPDAEARALAGHTFVGGLLMGGDVGRALRSLEARVRIARRFPSESKAHRFSQRALVVVNAVARATGGW